MNKLTIDKEIGIWIGKYQWSHFCTLTFKYPVAKELAIVRFKAWIRKLEHSKKGPVNWFYAVELQSAGKPHLHVLLGRTETFLVDRIRRAWTDGISQVRIYDPKREGSLYVTKSLSDEDPLWEVNLKNLAINTSHLNAENKSYGTTNDDDE